MVSLLLAIFLANTIWGRGCLQYLPGYDYNLYVDKTNNVEVSVLPESSLYFGSISKKLTNDYPYGPRRNHFFFVLTRQEVGNVQQPQRLESP